MTTSVTNDETFNNMTQDLKSKRNLEQMECEEEITSNVDNKRTKTQKQYFGNQLFLLDSSLVVKRDKQTILIEMQRQPFERNKESTYQLFQYFKNKLI